MLISDSFSITTVLDSIQERKGHCLTSDPSNVNMRCVFCLFFLLLLTSTLVSSLICDEAEMRVLSYNQSKDEILHKA